MNAKVSFQYPLDGYAKAEDKVKSMNAKVAKVREGSQRNNKK